VILGRPARCAGFNTNRGDTMAPIDDKRAQRIINRQLAMAVVTLGAMRQAGLMPDREIQLDFNFDAPNEEAAKALAAELASKDCHSLSIERLGRFFSRKHVVRGKTAPTVVTPETLEQWIRWMVVQGLEHNCEFDGFGAEI
jgi:Regulator of ribonuclease activity B